MKKIGLIVNPVAGMGGPAGMKGSDRAECVARARELNIEPVASKRAAEVLSKVKRDIGTEIALYAAPALMGEEEAEQAGFSPIVVGETDGGETSAADTIRIARLMLEKEVDLILFAGGDGTARDICEAVGQRALVMGIPSGVKMHSAVFTLHTMAAAQVILDFLKSESVREELREVMDLDEEAYAGGRVSAKLFGYLRVPYVQRYFQSLKAGGAAGGGEDTYGIAANIAERMEKDTECTYLIGAGSTTMALKQMLGIDGTLLGVDVVRNGKLIVKDADSRALEETARSSRIRIVVTPIGGQGFIFGRGSQQFSPEVLRAAGKQNITVICTMGKLAAFEGSPLLVDTGAPDTDEMLYGYIRVVTGRHAETVFKVAPTLD